jgi:16S rRNA C1402 (ribose-2'-O) methylase RsmI
LAAFQKNTTDLQVANKKIAVLEGKDRITGYLEQTRLFTAIPGKTPQVIAAELAGIFESQGEAKANEMLATYQGLDKMGQAALLATGTSRSGKASLDFEAAVQEYMKANPTVGKADANKHIMKAQPALYREYTLENDEK